MTDYAILVTCPHCMKRFTGKKSAIGKDFLCTGCKQSFTIQAASIEVPTIQAVNPPPATKPKRPKKIHYSKALWRAFLEKMLANLSSAKVWFFIWPFFMSSFFMGWVIHKEFEIIERALADFLKDKEALNAILTQIKVVSDTFIAWCTFNVSLAGTIVVVRETFKVAKLKQLGTEMHFAENGEEEEVKEEAKAMTL